MTAIGVLLRQVLDRLAERHDRDVRHVADRLGDRRCALAAIPVFDDTVRAAVCAPQIAIEVFDDTSRSSQVGAPQIGGAR